MHDSSTTSYAIEDNKNSPGLTSEKRRKHLI